MSIKECFQAKILIFLTDLAVGAAAFEQKMVENCGLSRIVDKGLAHKMQSFKPKIHHIFYLFHICFAKIFLISPQSNPKISFSTYGHVPLSWLYNDENPTSIAVFVLELFNLQYPTFYFEMDSNQRTKSFTRINQSNHNAKGRSVKLAAAMNNREFNDNDITEAFITAANGKLTVLKIN